MGARHKGSLGPGDTIAHIAGRGISCDHQTMAEPDSIFDWVDEERKARAIAEARADFAAGRSVPHAVVAEWLLKLATAIETGGERPPPPRSDRK